MEIIATHSGNFHPDDVFAVATIQMYLGEDSQVKIIRTRDKDDIDRADWAVDVGEIYDPLRRRFDHHQSGAPVRENGIAYAAFGLVWKELGESVCGTYEVFKWIEDRLVLPIDAGDNGIPLYDLKQSHIHPYELFHVINSYRPVLGKEHEVDDRFREAVDFAQGLLFRLIAHAKADIALVDYVREIYVQAKDKTVLVFDRSIDRHLLIPYPEVKAIVYPSSSNHGHWKASVVPIGQVAFDSRADFPQAWGGLRDDELVSVSGIQGAKFCHKGNFLFVADSQDGAVAAAKKIV